MLRKCVAVSLIVLWAAVASAQSSPAPQTDNGQTKKEPPPPLFPRHHRGIYRNAAGDDVIDATPQSPPLVTDDPGTPDQGEFEINLLTHADRSSAAQRYDLVTVDANYGMELVIAGYKLPTQLKFEFPIVAARDADEPFNVAPGAAHLGMKFNFYRDEHRGISVSVYPQIEFTAGGHGVDLGLAEAGQTVILPLLIAREFHSFTFVVNGAIEKALHDPGRTASSTAGVGFGRALTRKLAAMIELRSESSLDLKTDRLLVINGGVIHGVRNLIVYANVGHSLFADDHTGHLYAGAGVKMLMKKG